MLHQAQRTNADDEGSLLVLGEASDPPKSVLVIDDDLLHRMIICKVAAKSGYIAIEAASYGEAVELLRQRTFDCITLDLSLGPHAGSEMLRHLWVIGCKTPIIIISGCDDALFKETLRVGGSLNLSIWEIVPKPVDLSALRRSLENIRQQSDSAASQ
jgi:DNA-binding response OmpR family regulator